MCYDDNARPPLPPVGGAASDQGEIHLSSPDGNRFMAYFARAAEPSGSGVAILPDVRGLHLFYKELAQRFAEAGLDAVAIDYFGRTAGDGTRDETFEFMPHVQQVTMDQLALDVGAALAYLRSPQGGAVSRAFTVGFCFGGSSSLNQAALQDQLDGAIGLYGMPSRSRPYIATMHAPLLVIAAGQDRSTSPEESQAFDAELTQAQVAHRMVVYPNAPHSFFDRHQVDFAGESADAWEQMLGFIREPATS